MRDWIWGKYCKFFFFFFLQRLCTEFSIPLGIRESFREIAARRKRVHYMQIPIYKPVHINSVLQINIWIWNWFTNQFNYMNCITFFHLKWKKVQSIRYTMSTKGEAMQQCELEFATQGMQHPMSPHLCVAQKQMLMCCLFFFFFFSGAAKLLWH